MGYRVSEEEWKKFQADLQKSDEKIFKQIAGEDEGVARKPDKRRKFTGRSKFGNKPCTVDGYHFPSKLEAGIYNVLKKCSSASEQRMYFTRQVPFYLGSFKLVFDFVCVFPTETFILEAKGTETRIWKLKKKEFRRQFPHAKLHVCFSVKEAEELLRKKYREHFVDKKSES